MVSLDFLRAIKTTYFRLRSPLLVGGNFDNSYLHREPSKIVSDAIYVSISIEIKLVKNSILYSTNGAR